MLWIIVLASIIGFTSVATLATNDTIAPTLVGANAINLASSWHLISIGSSVALIILLLARLMIPRLKDKFNQPMLQWPASAVAIRIISDGAIFLLMLIASSSTGLYHYALYQHSLVTAPQTVLATVQIKQISDTISETLQVGQSAITIGNGYSRHIWQITKIAATENDLSSASLPLPLTVMVTVDTERHSDWQALIKQLRPNQTIQAKLKLQPITQSHNQNLPSNVKQVDLGFDEASWLQTRHIQAKAQLLALDEASLSEIAPTTMFSRITISIEVIRWQLRQQLLAPLAQTLRQLLLEAIVHPTNTAPSTVSQASSDAINSYAILLGLLTGDQALISPNLKNSYQITGISHLLAISGPHVLMLASLVSAMMLWLIKAIYPQLLKRLPAQLIILWVSVIVAGFYAVLVGFGLPAQRTFWMLLWVTIASQWLVNQHRYHALAWVGLLMMWLDNTAVFQAGFWLSFVAVGLLLKFSEVEADRLSAKPTDEPSGIQRIIADAFTGLKTLCLLQLWLFVLMMPIVIWFFGKLSWISLVTNLIAVPFLGLVIVPLDMLAGMLSFIPLVGDILSASLWALLAKSLTLFHQALQALIHTGWAKQSFVILSPSQLLFTMIIILIGFSRGIIPRLLILPLLIAIIATNKPETQQRAISPSLVVVNDAKLGIALLVSDNQAWLFLTENDSANQATNSSKNQYSRKDSAQHANPLFIHTTQLDTIERYLNEQIYPLLARYYIYHLTGIVNQTPSSRVNELVQRLALTIPTQHYWLAG